MAFQVKEYVSIHVFYKGFIFFTIFFIIESVNFQKNMKLPLDLHRNNTKKNYVILMIKNFTLDNLFSIVMIGILNLLILLFIHVNISFYWMIYYSSNLFMIFEITFLIVLAGRFANKESVYTIFCFVGLIIFYLFASMNLSLGISINPLTFIFKNSNIINISVHYLLWGYGSYLLMDYKCKKIEL